jgi:hypothetical protein
LVHEKKKGNHRGISGVDVIIAKALSVHRIRQRERERERNGSYEEKVGHNSLGEDSAFLLLLLTHDGKKVKLVGCGRAGVYPCEGRVKRGEVVVMRIKKKKVMARRWLYLR